VFLDAINPNRHDGEKIDTEVLLMVAGAGKDLLYSAIASADEVTSGPLQVDIASAMAWRKKLWPSAMCFCPSAPGKGEGAGLSAPVGGELCCTTRTTGCRGWSGCARWASRTAKRSGRGRSGCRGRPPHVVLGCRVFYSRQRTLEWFTVQEAKSLVGGETP
jgi:hypothetical protein